MNNPVKVATGEKKQKKPQPKPSSGQVFFGVSVRSTQIPIEPPVGSVGKHRCPFWLVCLKNRGPWFGWGLFHLPGPSIFPKGHLCGCKWDVGNWGASFARSEVARSDRTPQGSANASDIFFSDPGTRPGPKSMQAKSITSFRLDGFASVSGRRCVSILAQVISQHEVLFLVNLFGLDVGEKQNTWDELKSSPLRPMLLK